MSPKTVLITGASGGIGHALCQSYHDDGYEVFGLAREAIDPSPWKNFSCDLSKTNNIEDAIEKIFNEISVVPDILVNNAGAYHAKAWDEITIEEFNQTLQINSVAPFVITKIWLQKILVADKRGACVNVSSISGQIGSIDVSYAASKSALDMITKTLAKAVASEKIRINAVAPGPVETKMADKIPVDRQEKYKQNIPMKRFADVSEIVKTIKFLASDQASYITGNIVNIDGGLI